MPQKSKKILITTESREVFTVREKEIKALKSFCVECQTEVEWLTLDVSTSHTGKPTRELIRLIENGEIHSTEAESGHLLICRDSLGKIDFKK